MKKILVSLLGTLIFAPLPSLASELTITYEHDEFPVVYVANAKALVRLSIDDDENILGRVWSESGNAWLDAETVFTDVDSEFDLENAQINQLSNDTIVIGNGDDVVSFSADQGFQHFTVPTEVIGVGLNMFVSGNKASFVQYCSDGTSVPAVALWSEADGFSTATTLSQSICTGDAAYYAASQKILLDYYSGVAYDRSNSYAVVDTLDLSDLNYVNEEDDWDAQGNNPDVAIKKNGDVAFAFENSIFGFSYRDQVWHDLVTLADDFTVAGDDGQGDDDYSPLVLGNTEQVFVFVMNSAQTEYEIYRWSSANGWQSEQNYSFPEAADLVRTTSDKSKATLNWGFWLSNDSAELQVYQWSESNNYEKIVERMIDCTQCNLTLDISKKGKVFVAAVSGTSDIETKLEAWKPGTGKWQVRALPDSVSGNYLSTHVTADGRWIVVYQNNDSSYSVKRWTPDNGWTKSTALGADAIYYNEDQLYYLDLANDDTLTINFFQWKGRVSEVRSTIEDVETVYDNETFVYDGYLFVSYTSTNFDGNVVIPVEL